MRRWQPLAAYAYHAAHPVDSKLSGPYPMPCPRCESAAGYPFEATTQVGRVDVIRVAMRCRTCQYEWTTEVAMQPSSHPKSD